MEILFKLCHLDVKHVQTKIEYYSSFCPNECIRTYLGHKRIRIAHIQYSTIHKEPRKDQEVNRKENELGNGLHCWYVNSIQENSTILYLPKRRGLLLLAGHGIMKAKRRRTRNSNRIEGEYKHTTGIQTGGREGECRHHFFPFVLSFCTDPL
jgi:hypothetical protein